ncbi:MAG: hypothetical protein FJW36_10845 [Acidobacteria bacterium]|nr:hypothetical protein [Acidobacteriota bacterium]
MPRRSAILPLGLLLLASLMPGVSCAATLEQLSEERLINDSTEILRGTVAYCNQTYRPPVIWTVCEVNVTEAFKGSPGAKVQVAIPGGTAAGFRQSFEGSPTLTRNTEYVFFLWQGKSGLKQIMGLSQGLMNIAKDDKGNLIIVRNKSNEQMVNASGQPVEDTGLSMPLATLRKRTARGTRQ